MYLYFNLHKYLYIIYVVASELLLILLSADLTQREEKRVRAEGKRKTAQITNTKIAKEVIICLTITKYITI